MELLLAIAIGSLVGGGVYLTLRAHLFPVVLGITLLSYAVNLFLFASGRLVAGVAPLVDRPQAEYPDPLPQALVLTAIVIGFAMTAFQVVLSLRAYAAHGTDHVDGGDGAEPRDARTVDTREPAATAGRVAPVETAP
jgi:multicomponent K+:H+ antiporter subunit C